MNGINKAIQLAGGLTALANSLETTKGVVFQWRERGQVPAEYCPNIERLLNGAVLCEELNSKVDWAYLRAATQRAEDRTGEDRRTDEDRRDGEEQRNKDRRSADRRSTGKRVP